MDISNAKEPARLLRNAVMGMDGIPQVEPGTRIVYHRGPFMSLSESGRKVGAVARDLAEKGHVRLFQKKVGAETYEWMAVVRGGK